MNPVRVAIVDDALFIREGLRRLLTADARIAVVGTAATGEELLAHLEEWRPDVVTLDLNMPGLGGLGTLDRLMAKHPLPVIILSTHSGQGAPVTVDALSRGAADFIDKEAYSLVDFHALREVLVEKLLHLARRDPRPPAAPGATAAANGDRVDRPVDLLAIGASTGGPRAIEAILRALGPGFPAPITVVQHLPKGFTEAFAQRLSRTVGFAVREAVDGEVLMPGTAVIAPAGRHLCVRPFAGGFGAALHGEPANVAHCPAVDVLFESAAAAAGRGAVGVLLTGMGVDGAAGMTALVTAGAYTIAQDEATSVVYGMPRAAVARGAAREELPLAQIGPRLRHLAVSGDDRPPTTGARGAATTEISLEEQCVDGS